MSQRLFVAIDLPDGARARIAAAVADLRGALRARDIESAFRWVAIENLHLTLRFLGNLPDADAARVKAAMAAAVEQPPVPMSLGGLGTFPPRGRPRVLHVALTEGIEPLRRLRDAVDARLSPLCRWEHETRPFAPHLTLARTRDAAKFQPDEFSRLIAGTAWPAVSFHATHATLFSSRTLPAGPEYTAEARAALISR